MNFIHFIDDHVEEICKNGHIGIEHIFKNRCLTLEIIRRNYKYLRGIVKAYYPCKATLCSCAKKNTDEQLSELISRNPNIRLKDILEKLRDTVVENSEEIFFTKDTIDYWDLASKINVDELKFCYENNIFTTKLNGENSELFNFEWRLLCRLSKKASLKELEENPFIYSGEKFKKISNEIKSCWRALSANPNITLEFIKKHPEIKWDERELCKNPGLTIKDLYQLKEYTIKTYKLKKGKMVEEWKYTDICYNPNLVWGEPLPDRIPVIEPLLSTCKVRFETINLLSFSPEQISILSGNKDLPIQLVLKNPGLNWNYAHIVSNINGTTTELLQLPNIERYGRELSSNPNIHWYDTYYVHGFEWNYSLLADNQFNGPCILNFQKTIIYKWISEKYSGYYKRMATWLAYEVRNYWWSPDNKITIGLRERAFKLGKLKDWY